MTSDKDVKNIKRVTFLRNTMYRFIGIKTEPLCRRQKQWRQIFWSKITEKILLL